MLVLVALVPAAGGSGAHGRRIAGARTKYTTAALLAHPARHDDHGAAGRRVQEADDVSRGPGDRCCSRDCRAKTPCASSLPTASPRAFPRRSLLAQTEDAPRAYVAIEPAECAVAAAAGGGARNGGTVLSRVGAHRPRTHLARAVAVPDREHRGRRPCRRAIRRRWRCHERAAPTTRSAAASRCSSASCLPCHTLNLRAMRASGPDTQRAVQSERSTMRE